MNPHDKQYQLGRTVDSWARLSTLSARQRRALRLAYRGLTPWVYSRYGHRQWLAPLPGTRLVVKDPFALLSVPAIVEATGASVVLVYRHPGAVLSSYRRMGWNPDMQEVGRLVPVRDDDGTYVRPATASAADMAHFWAALYRTALDDLSGLDNTVVVAHEDLVLGGSSALESLFALCHLPWNASIRRATEELSSVSTEAPSPTKLHDFSRTPEEVALAWRSKVSSQDLVTLDEIAGDTLTRLAAARVRVV